MSGGRILLFSFAVIKYQKKHREGSLLWFLIAEGKGLSQGSVDLEAQAVPSPPSALKDSTTLLHAAWQKPLTYV